jgi:hypothetical protein
LITPVYGTPLLLVEGEERVLVAADLHLGLEHDLRLCGICIPSQTDKILGRLLATLEEIKPDRLLLLGDVKHNVPRTSWQEKREVPRFLESLASQIPVDVVPGNHDSDLSDMAPLGVRIRSSSGFVRDGIGYFHGHTWPDEKTILAERLVAAHLHPAISLKDPLSRPQSKPVWARARIRSDAAAQHYGLDLDCEIIIAPAFNHLLGGLPLNEPRDDFRGPLPSLVDWSSARIFLLDGTELGSLASIKAAQMGEEEEDRRGKRRSKGING